MNARQIEAMQAALPPAGGGIIVWLNSGQQLTAQEFTYDVSGLMYLSQQSGEVITVAMDQIAAYQYTPAEPLPAETSNGN